MIERGKEESTYVIKVNSKEYIQELHVIIILFV